ncbi:MAG: ribonuclease P protein component [Prolixibacteraceae bacterium]|nr:ribonuclease P protein component [Burkholderiales bacterium]
MKAARFRLPRRATLRGKAHFTGAFAARRQGKFFVVLSRNNTPGEQARLGIVIGRQTAPRSVTRSLMKRTVREVFRQLRGQLGPVDVVVRVRQSAGRSDLTAARHELEKLLRETC